VVPADASVGLPFVGLDGDWLSLNVGFLLLGAAFLGMMAFNVIMWQQVRRVHAVAERRPDPRKGRHS
jgi:hypothetical protein